MMAALHRRPGCPKGQGIGAEMIADQWGISREELDAFSARSHQRAARATAEGRFENEIVPVAVRDDEGKDTDEIFADRRGHPTGLDRRDAGQAQARLQGGRQGHGRELLADHRRRLGRAHHERGEGERARAAAPARFHAFALAGVDPVTMLTGPIPATTTVLERAKLTLDDIDAVEINEAFASVVLAWEKEHHPNMEIVNPNGGAIALGHPLGASGGKLMATLLNELERTERSLRAAHHVRGRRAGQRHHHRAPGLRPGRRAPGPGPWRAASRAAGSRSAVSGGQAGTRRRSSPAR